MPPRRQQSSAVIPPNMGLVLDRPQIAVPPNGLVDGKNFRIKFGRIDATNLGRSKLITSALNNVGMFAFDFILSNGTHLLVFASLTDLYNYNNGTPKFLTPVYATGTIAVTSGGVVTGTGTLFHTTPTGDIRTNVQAGDYIYIGSATQNDPTAQWWKVASVTNDTTLQLASYTGGTVAAGASYTCRQTFTGSQDNRFEGEFFPNAAPSLGDLLFITNGVDSIVTWNGSTTFAVRQTPTLGFTCFDLFRYKDMMLYLGTTNVSGTATPYSMTNSDIGSPLVVNSGAAAVSIVTDSDAPILQADRLYDNLIIYCGNATSNKAIVVAQFLGPPLGFVFREMIVGRGPIGQNLVANFGYYHRFVDQDGQWSFNGLFLQPSGTHVMRAVMNSYDASRIKRGFCLFDHFNGEVIWAIPLTTDQKGNGPEVAYVEHYLETNEPDGQVPFSKRDFVATAGGLWVTSSARTFNLLTNAWNTYSFRWNDNQGSSNAPIIVVVDALGNVLQLNSGNTDYNGAALSPFVTFPPRLAGDQRVKGLVRRVYPFIEVFPGASYGLTVTTSVFDRIGGNPTKTVANTFDITGTQPNRFVNPFVVGRLVQEMFGTTGANQPFIMDGYDLDITPAGAR